MLTSLIFIGSVVAWLSSIWKNYYFLLIGYFSFGLGGEFQTIAGDILLC